MSDRSVRGMVADHTRDALELVWRDRRLGVSLAVGGAALWGLLAGRWTPRGPLTTSQALWSIVISLVVGAMAGVVMRSRWGLAAAPAAFASGSRRR